MSGRRGVEALRLYYLKKRSTFDGPVRSRLPAAYQKFWQEWKQTPSTPVHWIPEEGKWKRNEETGVVTPVQNVPIPVLYPVEHHSGIWGGEGVVKGFIKRHPQKRRVPHFWFPTLKRSVVYSEVLDKYMNVVVTTRTIDLIHQNYGFDFYLLKTKACDLKSVLALKLKKEILQCLLDKSLYPDDPVKREEIYNRYEKYLANYTPEEIEWYGLTMREAVGKLMIIEKEAIVIKPLKHQFREKLIAELKATEEEEKLNAPEESVSWLSKLNPLSKSTKTT